MTLPTLFIPVLHENNKHTLISTKRMKALRDLLPSFEEIVLHLKLEKERIERNKNYKPEPYIITLPKSKYGAVLNEVKVKIKGYDLDKITLLTSSESAPLIVIRKK